MRMLKKHGPLFIFSLFLVACQQMPTQVYQSQPITSKETDGRIAITEQTVVVDARPAFEYSISHLNGSLHLRPEDFTQKESPYLGLLDADHFSLTRRLARYGISPETPVVVVGRGLEGQGEEGRMAWTLKYLGVRDVQFADVKYFSLPLSTAEAPPRENTTIWKPQINEALQASRTEVSQLIKTPRAKFESTVLIDVRTSEEYLGKAKSKLKKTPPDIGAINIPWTEFLTPLGLPNKAVQVRLESIGITADRKLILISNQGVRSAAATMALQALGYGKAANFSGGYLELLGKRK